MILRRRPTARVWWAPSRGPLTVCTNSTCEGSFLRPQQSSYVVSRVHATPELICLFQLLFGIHIQYASSKEDWRPCQSSILFLFLSFLPILPPLHYCDATTPSFWLSRGSRSKTESSARICQIQGAALRFSLRICLLPRNFHHPSSSPSWPPTGTPSSVELSSALQIRKAHLSSLRGRQAQSSLGSLSPQFVSSLWSFNWVPCHA